MTTKELYLSQHLQTVRLYGKLGVLFGRTHRLAVNSTAEAVRALCVLHKGFEKYLVESREHGVGFAVFLGKRNIGESELQMNTQHEIRIAPILMGSKNGGIFSIILGVALIAVSFFIPGGGLIAAGLFNAGVAMALGGVVQLLSPQPKDPKSKDDPDNEANYAFNGPINTQAQGNCVPVAYGKPWCGSAVVSAGIQVGDDIYVPAIVPVADAIMAMGPEWYFPLNDGSGGECTDRCGNLPNLVLYGDYTAGGSLRFNGTGNAAVVCGSHLDWPLEELTVMMRIQLNALPLSGVMLGGMVNNSILGFFEFGFFLADDGLGNFLRPRVVINHMAGAGQWAVADTNIGVGGSYIIALRRNGAVMDIVINGRVAGSGPCTGSFAGSCTMMLNEHFFPSMGDYFTISDWAGFRRALSDAECGVPQVRSGGMGDSFADVVEEAL